ncbi:MAG: hypothetical protein ACYDIC_07090 [Desulfobaccales bacterium]
MSSFLKNHHSVHGKEAQAPSSKRMGLKTLAIVGLGAMMVTCFSLLPGCGSESDTGKSVKAKSASEPVGSAKAKKEKTAATSAAGQQAIMPLIIDEEGSGPGKMPKAKPNSPQPGEVLPGLSREQAEAMVKASRTPVDPKTAKTMEILPGVTKEEWDSKASRTRVPEKGEALPPPVKK